MWDYWTCSIVLTCTFLKYSSSFYSMLGVFKRNRPHQFSSTQVSSGFQDTAVSQSAWRRDFLRLWLLALGALLLIGGLTAYSLVAERQAIEARERERLASQAQIIHESLARQFDSINRALVNIRDEWPASQQQPGDIIPRLKAFVDAMPGVRGMFILDATGALRASNFTELIGNDLRDRAYFQAALNHPSPDTLYLSPPFRTALDVWSVNLVRMMPGPRGEFAGIVAATLDPEELQIVLRSINYAGDMWSGLAHGDGLQILIEPDRPDLEGLNLAQPGSFFSRHRDSGLPANVLTGRVHATGEYRMMATRTIQPPELHMDKPLVLAIGRDLHALYAPWQRDVWIRGVLLGLLALSSATGLYLLQRRKLRSMYQISRVQAALRQKIEEQDLYFEIALNPVCVIDLHGRFVKLNSVWETVLGYPLSELEGASFLDFVHPEDLDITHAALNQLTMKRKVSRFINRYRHRDGSYREIEWQAAPHGDLIFADARDVTQERRHQTALLELNAQLQSQSETLRSLAFLDGLTGVANRRRFDEKLQTEWRQCLRSQAPLALLLFDVDLFKLYNDHYGHQAGDACLQAVAMAMRERLGRPHDLLARYGGEEFVCLLPDTDQAGAEAKADELRLAVMALDIPHDESPAARVVTVSVGIVSWIPREDTTPEQLLLAADAALYEAKTRGRNRVCGAPPAPAPATGSAPAVDDSH